MVKVNFDLKTKVINLFNNRALAFQQAGNIAEASCDANHILENLDPKNAKALYRRANGYKAIGKLEKAVKDMEQLTEQEPNNE
jgi:tetratricopeptide (TPR) repeat protein